MYNKMERMVTQDLAKRELGVRAKTKELLETYLDSPLVFKNAEEKDAYGSKLVRYRYNFTLPTRLSLIIMNNPIIASVHQDYASLHYSLLDGEERYLYLISEDIFTDSSHELKIKVGSNLEAGETILMKCGSLVYSAIFVGYHTFTGKNSYVFQVMDIYDKTHNLREERYYEYVVQNPPVYDEKEVREYYTSQDSLQEDSLWDSDMFSSKFSGDSDTVKYSEEDVKWTNTLSNFFDDDIEFNNGLWDKNGNYKNNND